MKTKILIFIALCVVFVGSCTKDTMEPNPKPVVVNVAFSTTVYPIFSQYNCTGCHGGFGGLILSGTPSEVRASLLSSNTPAVVPSSSATSKLYNYFNGTSHNSRTLTATEVAAIKGWIDAGAKND